MCNQSSCYDVRYGLNSLSFRGSLLWNTLKDEIKRAGTLTNFKKTDQKVGWKSMSLLNLQISLLFFSFICIIIKYLF